MDAEFARAEPLQPLPRLVYALLRSPLLPEQPRLNGRAHPDAPAALRHLCASLPPRDLRCALYPTLSSFADPDTLARTPPPHLRCRFRPTRVRLLSGVQSMSHACPAEVTSKRHCACWHMSSWQRVYKYHTLFCVG